MRAHIRVGILALCFVAAVAIVPLVNAQTGDAGKWEVEIHAGGEWPTNPVDGTTNAPTNRHTRSRARETLC